MGCASSSAQDKEAFAPPPMQRSSSIVQESYQKRRKMSAANLNDLEKFSLTSMFHAATKASGKKSMSYDELKSCLAGQVGDSLLELVWRLFDQDSNGCVDADEFGELLATEQRCRCLSPCTTDRLLPRVHSWLPQ